MPWFAASAILFTKFKDGNQDEYPVWENVYLIRASTPRKALRKAAQLARNDSGDFAGTYTYNRRPATLVFAGIRKLIDCDNAKCQPKDGTEITYSQYVVKGKRNFKRLVAGDPVAVLYRE